MTSGAPPVRPLDVRREQLRELGHTDAEISAIILKEVPPPQPQAAATGMTGAGGVAGQTGVMSGVLNNLSVAMALATGFLPSIATDITHLLGAHSSLHERSRAGVFLAVKLALVAVIGFAIFQEYQQHYYFQYGNCQAGSGEKGGGGRHGECSITTRIVSKTLTSCHGA